MSTPLDSSHGPKTVCALVAFALLPFALAASSAEQVEAVQAQRFAAMVRADVAALGDLLADDLTYTHSTGQVETREQFLRSLSSGALRYESIAPQDVRVRLFGGVAVVTARPPSGSARKGATPRR